MNNFSFLSSHLKMLKIAAAVFIKSHLLSKSESVKFSLIESVICFFSDSSVKKYFSLSNKSVFTEIISEI